MSLHSCDKEVTVSNSFPFEVSADFDSETFINIPIEATFDLTPQQVVSSNVYSASYRVLEGKASLLLPNGDLLIERELYTMNGLRFKPTITPKSVGTITIEFTFVDLEGETTIKIIDFYSNETSFLFTATRSLATLPIGERLQVSYDITEQGTTSVDQYTLVFSNSKNGIMTVNSVDYKAGDKIIVPSLNFIAFYTPNATGEHIITSNITAKSSNVTISKNISVNVEASDFEFTVSSNSEVTVGESIDLSFNVNELVGNSNFKIKYSITGPSNQFTNNNGVILSANTDYDIDNTFIWKLKGIIDGSMDVTFTITNQYGVSKSKTLSIIVKPIDFNFDVSPIGTAFNLGESIPFSFTMDAPSSLTYEISFNSNTDGTLEVNSKIINENTFTSVFSTSFDVGYNPIISGTSIIYFTIRASNGVSKTKQISIIINQDPLVTDIEVQRGSSCGSSGFYPMMKVSWTKASNVFITNIYIKAVTANIEEFSFNLTTNDNNSGFFNFKCFHNVFKGQTYPVEVYITDNRGVRSKLFIKNLTF